MNENNTKALLAKAQSLSTITESHKKENTTKENISKNKALSTSLEFIKTTQSNWDLSPYLCVEQKARHDLRFSVQDIRRSTDLVNTTFPYDLDFAESSFDCSIELVDVSLSSTINSQNIDNETYIMQLDTSQCSVQQQFKPKKGLQKQNSFEMDDSLRIVTMDEVSANNYNGISEASKHKLLGIDQTSSPEELPLDSIELETNIDIGVISIKQRHYQKDIGKPNLKCSECSPLHIKASTSTTDSINKINIPKLSTSFITSVTSVTSLDTGYQGDGEMSRPGSRGASENASSTTQLQKGLSHQLSSSFHHYPSTSIRRQDLTSDSDFFTESDADDIHNRGDRNAHIIDGQLYTGRILSPITSVQNKAEDSCMESSGIFTDFENRGHEYFSRIRYQITDQKNNSGYLQNVDVHDGSDSNVTVKSNYEKTNYSIKLIHDKQMAIKQCNTYNAQAEFYGNNEICTVQKSVDSNNTTILSHHALHSNKPIASTLNKAFKRNTNNDVLRSFNAKKTQIHEKTQKSFTTSTTTSLCDPSLIYIQQVPKVQKIASQRKYASLPLMQNNVDTIKGFQEDNKAIVDSLNETSIKSVEKGNMPLLVSSVRISNRLLKENVKENKISNISNKPRTKFTQKNCQTNALGSCTGNKKVLNNEKSSKSIIVSKYQMHKCNTTMNQMEKNKTSRNVNYNNVKSKVASQLNASTVLNTSSIHSELNNNKNTHRPPISNKVQVTIDKHSSVNLKLKNNWHIKSDITNSNVKSIVTGINNTPTSRINQHGSSYKRSPLAGKNQDFKVPQNAINCTRLGSSKSMTKFLLRTAKKRDVRNLSISSNNLGPPSKSQQTRNAGAVQHKFSSSSPSCAKLTQKRHSSNDSNKQSGTLIGTSMLDDGISSYEDVRSSLSNKKSSSNTRCKETKIKAKTNKDHSQTPSLISPLINACKHDVDSDLSNMVVTKIADVTYTNNNNNDSVLDKLVDSIPRTPELLTKSEVHNDFIVDCNIGEILRKQDKDSYPQSYETFTNKNASLKSSVLVGHKDSDCHLFNNRLNSRTLGKHSRMQDSVTHKIAQDKSLEALAILLNYVVFDLDAFSCPGAKAELLKTKKQLKQTDVLLEKTKSAFNDLKNEMLEKENFYKQRENELHALHHIELEKAYAELTELQDLTKAQIEEFEIKLRAKDSEIKCTVDSYNKEMKQKISEKDELIKGIEERERILRQKYTVIAQSERKLREKVASLETSCAGRLQIATDRENELTERLKCLSTEVEKLRANKDDSQRNIKYKSNFSQDDIAILRTARTKVHSLNESNVLNSQRSANNSMLLTSHNIEICRLQSEAESLRCVLELKQKEISKLIKRNEELLRDAEEKSTIQNKVSCLESKNELLQSELNIKSEREKEFLRQIDEMQKALNHETIKRTRLSYDNEALQWQLKQRSEQLHIIEAKLSELSTNNDISHAITSQSRPTCNNLNGINSFPDVYEGSPPPSPIIKGVIEKSDSVSWILEMDDQTPEVAASKVVKRAGPFRSVERNSPARRHIPFDMNVTAFNVHPSLNYTNFASALEKSCPSESRSAVPVEPQHSTICTIKSKNRLNSKSVSTKISETSISSVKKLQRSYSLENNDHMLPLCSKNLVNTNALKILPLHSRNHNLKGDTIKTKEPIFKNTSDRKLISCDMSTLNVEERLDSNTRMTKHSSIKALNITKKPQEIKESAGEALISDTNSDDESCSAFSDDATSLASISSNTSASPTLSRIIKERSLFMDDALLIEKINLSQDTSKKIIWSEKSERISNASSL